MAQLIVRKLEEYIVGKLKIRASQRGHSAEEEHRIILREALSDQPATRKVMPLKDYLLEMPVTGIELDLPKRNHPSERKLEF